MTNLIFSIRIRQPEGIIVSQMCIKLCLLFKLPSITDKYYGLCWLMNVPNEPRHEIANNIVCATSKASDQSAHMLSLIRAFANHLNSL